MLKKILKYGLYGLGGLVVIVGGLAVWQWDSISILISNKDLSGKIAGVPEITLKELPALSKGKTDWTCWNKKDGRNEVTIANVPTDWSKGLKKLWEVSYLCQGSSTAAWSAPVIKGNRLIACGRNGDEDMLFCLNPDTGELMWHNSYKAEAGSSYGRGFRATPWIDGDYVYTFGRSGDLVCWKLFDGAKVWHQNVKEQGGEEPRWGLSSSPYVTDKAVVVDAGGSARTIAYDKKSGDVLWKTGEGVAGYAAITSMMVGGKKVLLDFYGKGLAAVDPDTGKEFWNTPWITSYDVNATTPMVVGDSVFITSGYGSGCELLKVNEKGTEVVWKNENIASHHSDPFIIDGYIFGYSGQSMQNKGDFKCLDLKTGEVKWSTGDMGWGTAIKVNDYLMCMDIKGNLFLMKPNPETFVLAASMKKALGKVKGAAWTKPIVANGKLYLRTKQKLVCYDFR